MNTEAMMQELLKGFVAESKEISERLTLTILQLERVTDPAAREAGITDIARGLHTLKGSAATLGLEGVADLAHKLEDILAPVRKEKSPVTSQLADALLSGLDTLLSSLTAQVSGQTDTAQMLAEGIQGLPLASGAEATLGAGAESASGATEEGAGGAHASEADEWRVGTRHVLSMMKGVERMRELRARLEERRAVVLGTLRAVQRGTIDTDELRTTLMNLARWMGTDAEEVHYSVTSLEDDLKEICTRPLRTIIDPLQRTVRDLCRILRKEVRLSSVGGELALDRRLLETLKAPLMHLVRNAVDHGFESPEAREVAGKHREGVLTIRAEQVGNLLTLEVSDDGRGFDTRRIAEVAVARGMISREDASVLTAQEIHQLVFHSGFSTREEVTETSGRGVGLDVVKAQLASMQGQVDLYSTLGQGTRFLLTVPLELGASAVLVSRCGEHEVGIPLNAIERLMPIREDQVRVSRNQMQLVDADEVFPLLDLTAELGLRQYSMPRDGQPVALLQVDGERIAVAIDGIVGDRELVVRPLPIEVRHIDAFQGSASTVDGQQILILRTNWLSSRNKRQVRDFERARRVLVVDDSLTARALHRTILEAAGYGVHAVSSGARALEQLARATYDAIISDVSMEHLDGIELTRLLRADPRLCDIPVVLVTARDEQTDRARGLEAGADAWLSKRECAEGRLLEEVGRILRQRADA